MQDFNAIHLHFTLFSLIYENISFNLTYDFLSGQVRKI